MLHTDERFSEAVEAVVGELEARTDAEIVVVAAARSGSYRDVAFAGASACALVGLAAFLFMPWTVHPWSVVLEIALLWALMAWVLGGPHPVRILTRRARREAQVRTAALAEFHTEAVHGTPNRTGVLVYVSALEGQVEVVPDAGIEGRIPRGRWAKAVAGFQHDDLDHFVAGLRQMGEVLAEFVPKLENDVVDLPNAPRIRP